MPNTKSAERRARNSSRKHQHNHSIKAQLKSLEKRYLGTLSSANSEQSQSAYRTISSALDKAAKTGIIHRAMANRKKSRLALRLKAKAAAPAAPATPAPAATN